MQRSRASHTQIKRTKTTQKKTIQKHEVENPNVTFKKAGMYFLSG